MLSPHAFVTMKSVAIFVKNLTSGGAEKQAVILANQLSEHAHVDFVVFNAAKIHEKYRQMLADKVTFVPFSGSFYSRFKQLRHYMKSVKPQFVFSYLTGANILACLSAQGLDIKVITGLRNSRLPKLKLWADRFATNHLASGTIANCYSGRDFFIGKGFRADKISVIHNCIDPVLPTCDKKQHDTVEIITVGRFVAQKDYATAIAAMARAMQVVPTLRFTIVGYGELEGHIRSLISKHGIGHATKIYINSDNISSLLAKADIYLSTSLFEGLSNSILEAMNADLPIVATNVGDNAHIVKDGLNGILADVADSEALSQAIISLAGNRDKRCQMGVKSKDILLKDFTRDIFTRRYNVFMASFEKSGDMVLS